MLPDHFLLGNSAVIHALLQVQPENQPVYLVGGSVRDALLQRQMHDFDFAVSQGALQLGRRLANSLGGAFYPLDEGRETARVIWFSPDGRRVVIDIALLRGKDLQEDLRGRDFTINAMALDIRQLQTLIDPLGGLQDLQSKVLRVCSPDSLESDPVRVLRAVRQAVVFGLKIPAETRSRLRQAAPQLAKVTPERVRDELFRMLEGAQPESSLRLMEHLGALKIVLPELDALRGVQQPPPHVMDVWEHTLGVMQRLAVVLRLLAGEHDPDAAANLGAGLLTVRLGRFRQQIEQHLASQLNPDRSLRSLYFLAALYHDAGKPQTRTHEQDGQIHFYEHERFSVRLFSARAHALRLSSQEIERLGTIIRHHMRPLWLANSEGLPSRRAIYRFFRDTGPAGVDICLFSLADVWATYSHTLPQAVWRKHLDVVRVLLDAWWEQKSQLVSPPVLINGHDLMQALELEPGPLIGDLLDAIREAQAEGTVHSREEAIAFAQAEVHDEKRGSRPALPDSP